MLKIIARGSAAGLALLALVAGPESSGAEQIKTLVQRSAPIVRPAAAQAPISDERLLEAESELAKQEELLLKELIKRDQRSAPALETFEEEVHGVSAQGDSQVKRIVVEDKTLPPLAADEPEVVQEAEPESAPKLQESAPAVTAPKKKKVAAKQAKPAKSAPSKTSTTELEGLIDRMQQSTLELAQKLRERDSRITIMQREIDELRSRLIVAETERERLAERLDARNRSSLGSLVGEQRAQGQPDPRASLRNVPPARKVQAEPESDMSIATVVVDKAALRTGPGPNNSPLMEVPRGTRLTVEKRQGNWYRVNTPNGTRAWISGEVVDFKAAAGQSGSLARTRGYDAGAEEEAYKLLQKDIK